MKKILRKTEDDLEIEKFDGGGYPVYSFNGKLFTGILVDYYKDGSLAAETECQNGFLEGVYKEYYKSGQQKLEYILENNLITGIYREWDEEGNLIKEIDVTKK